MFFMATVRRPVSLAARFFVGQSYNYNCGALFTGFIHTANRFSNELVHFPLLARHYSSASPSLNCPSSDQSLSESTDNESSDRRSNALKGPSKRGSTENLWKVFHKYAESRHMLHRSFYEEKSQKKRKIKKLELPTHYMEVNYRTLKAVVFYGPNMGHVPHKITSKDLSVLR